MSELKAYYGDVYIPVYGSIADAQVYLKSEADKVIAELKKACNDKDDWCLHTLKENRHHKYNRCLAMAKLCNEKWLVHNFAEIPTKLGFYDRWQKRWLKIAEKFKPNNSTAQQGKGNKMINAQENADMSMSKCIKKAERYGEGK